MHNIARYETRSDMEWHKLSDKTRSRRNHVGDIKFSIAWGPNEKTILTVQIEEGFALTKYLQSSFMAQGRKARSFFSKKKEDDQKETLPSAFLKFSIDGINKRKTKVVKVEMIACTWLPHERISSYGALVCADAADASNNAAIFF